MITSARLRRWLSAITAAAVVVGAMWLPCGWIGRHRIGQRPSHKAILRLLTPARWVQFVETEQSSALRNSDDLDEDTPIPLATPDDLRPSVSAMQNGINYLESEENNHAYDLNLPGVAPKAFTLISSDEEMKRPPAPAETTQPAAPSSAPTASGNGGGQ